MGQPILDLGRAVRLGAYLTFRCRNARCARTAAMPAKPFTLILAPHNQLRGIRTRCAVCQRPSRGVEPTPPPTERHHGEDVPLEVRCQGCRYRAVVDVTRLGLARIPAPTVPAFLRCPLCQSRVRCHPEWRFRHDDKTMGGPTMLPELDSDPLRWLRRRRA